MVRSDYGPEVKAAMQPTARKGPPPPPRRSKEPGPGDTPADMARDKARGIVEGSAQDEALDARNVAPPQQHAMPPQHNVPPQMPPHHVAAAAGIAHAILSDAKPGGGY